MGTTQGKVSPEELVSRYLGFAESVAKKLARSHPIDQDDAISVAYEGLWQAAQRFDWDRWDPSISTFDKMFQSAAYRRITGAILDEVRRTQFVKRRGYEKGIRFAMVPIDKFPDDCDLFEEMASQGLDLGQQEIMNSLDDEERRIAVGLISGYTSKELSESLGVTTGHIAKVKKGIKEKLSVAIAADS